MRGDQPGEVAAAGDQQVGAGAAGPLLAAGAGPGESDVDRSRTQADTAELPRVSTVDNVETIGSVDGVDPVNDRAGDSRARAPEQATSPEGVMNPQPGTSAGVDPGTQAYLRERERSENFPVALRILPRSHRRHLQAVYDVARVIDDLGDEGDGDRSARLRAFAHGITTLWAGGTPEQPVLRRLADTRTECDLSAQPFLDLVEANLRDQERTHYATFDELVAYCALSANPVGRIVLQVFGVDTPARVALSDRICTALQVIEHCQDVIEDRRAGRIYLPLEDFDRFGVVPSDLDAPQTTPGLRRLVGLQADRAGALLDSGLPLLRQLSGWARVAVTGYVAGGRATLYALKRARWDVISSQPRPKKTDIAAQAVLASFGRGVTTNG